MMETFKKPPIDVVDLLPVLDDLLIELLESLSAEDWEKPTVARLWTVKDIAAHLLDGNIRLLSMLRDGFYGEKPAGDTFGELVVYLNRLNADWVKAMKRVSPEMLIYLHRTTGKAYCDYYRSLDPFGKSALPVSWAGESESRNWMHIAREFTEKWLHQQQIREAIGNAELFRADLFEPFMESNMNNPDIVIEDVDLQLDKSGRYIEGKVQFTITLKNKSETLTYYALKRPRDIDYNKDSHTLSIGLYEKELLQDTKASYSPFAPEQVAILPGTTFQWQYLIPIWMKKITRPAGSREIVEVVNISGVQKVVCTVAYHTSPFRVEPSTEGGEVLAALSKWGETVSASFERTL